MHDGFGELCYHLGCQFVNSQLFMNCDVNHVDDGFDDICVLYFCVL